ncbi:unnamed protein product [Clavelina lepadiformis]|uniref:Uncharacterized protein n=1 Tax=Clavelina lepadiformis TaxID=159417 RepID=A0ABP0FRM3_CLALP
MLIVGLNAFFDLINVVSYKQFDWSVDLPHTKSLHKNTQLLICLCLFKRQIFDAFKTRNFFAGFLFVFTFLQTGSNNFRSVHSPFTAAFLHEIDLFVQQRSV